MLRWHSHPRGCLSLPDLTTPLFSRALFLLSKGMVSGAWMGWDWYGGREAGSPRGLPKPRLLAMLWPLRRPDPHAWQADTRGRPMSPSWIQR